MVQEVHALVVAADNMERQQFLDTFFPVGEIYQLNVYQPISLLIFYKRADGYQLRTPIKTVRCNEDILMEVFDLDGHRFLIGECESGDCMGIAPHALVNDYLAKGYIDLEK